MKRRFGNLVFGKKVKGKLHECKCDCGNTVLLYYCNLLGGRKTCGCKSSSETHGMRYTKFYGIWKGINGRCYCKSNACYLRGSYSRFESDWKGDFLKFKKEMYSSYLKHVKEYGEKQTTIDRLDNKKGYTKSNCRWATNKEQNRNRSNTVWINIDGTNKPLGEWAEECGLNYQIIYQRYKRDGFTGNKLLKPVRQRKKSLGELTGKY